MATKHLTPIQDDDAALAKYAGNFAFLGTALKENVAQAVADGLMDPITGARFLFGDLNTDLLVPTPAQDTAFVASLPRIESFFKPHPAASSNTTFVRSEKK